MNHSALLHDCEYRVGILTVMRGPRQITKKIKKETTFDPSLLKLFGQAKFVFGQVIIIVTCPNGQVGKKVNVEPCSGKYLINVSKL